MEDTFESLRKFITEEKLPDGRTTLAFHPTGDGGKIHVEVNLNAEQAFWVQQTISRLMTEAKLVAVVENNEIMKKAIFGLLEDK